MILIQLGWWIQHGFKMDVLYRQDTWHIFNHYLVKFLHIKVTQTMPKQYIIIQFNYLVCEQERAAQHQCATCGKCTAHYHQLCYEMASISP